MVRYVPQPNSKTKVDIDDAYVGIGGICLLRGWSKVTQKMQFRWRDGTLSITLSLFYCSSNLIGGDIFLDFSMVALIEAVADLINLYVIDHLGRKTNLVFV